MIIESGDIDRHAYRMIAAEGSASFNIIEELRRKGNELLNKYTVKDQIPPKMAIVQDDRLP